MRYENSCKAKRYTQQEMKDRAEKISARLDYQEPALSSEEIDELICDDYIIDTVDKDMDEETGELNDRIEEELQDEAIRKLTQSGRFAEVMDNELIDMIYEISKMGRKELDARQKELIELTKEDSIVGSVDEEEFLGKEIIDGLLDAAEEVTADDEAKIKEKAGKEMANEFKEAEDDVWSIDNGEVESITSTIEEYVDSAIKKAEIRKGIVEDKYYRESANEAIDCITEARVNYMNTEPTITISTELAGKIVKLLNRF